MTASREIRLDTTRGVIAGLHWPAPGAPPVLAVHGWLDNAASFTPLAPHLEGLDLVALDLPGHGRSEHRPAGSHYYFADYLFDIEGALDALGWEKAHLIGHSLGGAIASLYAAGGPQRVLSLTALDGLGPVTGHPGDTAARLQRSLETQRHARSSRKTYESVESMVAARLENSRDLTPEAARLICERASKRTDRGFEWRFDRALYGVSPIMMTERQVLDCLAAITAPVLTLTARPLARWITENQARGRVDAVTQGSHETIEGNHHFHMDQAAATGRRILAFIRGVGRAAGETT